MKLKFNTSDDRFTDVGYLRPKDGILPMHLPHEEVVVVEDVHLGRTHIWKNMKGTLFCDIDGTIADLTERRVYVASKPKNWPAFERGIPNDLPIPTIIRAVRELHAAGWTVVMCTGRGAQNKDVTIDWLKRHDVPFDAIYTRPRYEIDPETGAPKISRKGNPMGDYRRDDIIKAELLEKARADGYDPDVVFDDRNQVVEMWRRVGVPCVQVAEGDF
jgi:hypothetical protein